MARRGRAAVPETFFRIRSCNLCRAAFRLNTAIKLLDRLAFLATDLFAGVADTFALVRLRRVITANVSSDLADNFFVRALDRDLRVVRHRDFDVFRNRKQDWMRKAETEIQVLALNGGFETDA